MPVLRTAARARALTALLALALVACSGTSEETAFGGGTTSATPSEDPAPTRDGAPKKARRASATPTPTPTTPPPPLELAGNAIGGTVTDRDGAPIEGVCVDVFNGPGWDEVADLSARTNRWGQWEAGPVWPARNRYRVLFRNCAGDRWAAQWYDGLRAPASIVEGRNAATAISKSSGVPASGIDARLARAGAVEGEVRDATGARVTGREVIVEAYDRSSVVVGSATTTTGRYRIGGLHPGRYRMRYRVTDGSLGQEWWPDALDGTLASPVRVREGETREDLDVTLSKAGRISGRVTGTAACAYAHSASGETIARAVPSSMDDGVYVLAGLRAATYRVRFDDCDEDAADRYGAQWWNARGGFADADPIEVRAGRTTEGVDGAPSTSGGGGAGSS